jgi:hypothetical protein
VKRTEDRGRLVQNPRKQGHAEIRNNQDGSVSFQRSDFDSRIEIIVCHIPYFINLIEKDPCYLASTSVRQFCPGRGDAAAPKNRQKAPRLKSII